MAAALKPGWSKPSTILFASEIPANQKAFAFALAQAQEFASDLILFHAYDTLVVAASEASGIRYYDYAAAARSEKQHLEPLAQRAREAGIHCEVVVRPGLPADEILAYTHEREIERIVMGTHSPGPIGKLLVGSVAEAVLRTASSPVYIIGPDVVDGSYSNFATRTILCAVSLHEASTVVAAFAAELAAQHGARLILQHVIRPQERAEFLAGRSLDEVEAGMLALIPTASCGARSSIQTIVVPGDPTEELLYQCHTQQRRPDRSRCAGCFGFCRHHSPRCGLQDPGPHPMPGHHAFAGSSRSMRLEV
jgi:nucleotide-binding universal stress UspA family protein